MIASIALFALLSIVSAQYQQQGYQPSPQAYQQSAHQPAPAYQPQHQSYQPQPQSYQPQPQSYQPQPQSYQPQPQSYQPQAYQAPPAQNPRSYAPAAVHYVNIGAELAGDYKFGYDTGKNNDGQSFREETRLPDGTVQGAYGYVDASGKQRLVKYTAGKNGFQVEGDGIPKQPAAPAPAQAAQPQPGHYANNNYIGGSYH